MNKTFDDYDLRGEALLDVWSYVQTKYITKRSFANRGISPKDVNTLYLVVQIWGSKGWFSSDSYPKLADNYHIDLPDIHDLYLYFDGEEIIDIDSVNFLDYVGNCKHSAGCIYPISIADEQPLFE